MLAAAPKRLAGSGCSSDEARSSRVESCIERGASGFSEAETVSGAGMTVELAGASWAWHAPHRSKGLWVAWQTSEP